MTDDELITKLDFELEMHSEICCTPASQCEGAKKIVAQLNEIYAKEKADMTNKSRAL